MISDQVGVPGRPRDKESVWYYVCLMGIIQSKCVLCIGITLMSKWKCLRAKRIVGDLDDPSRIPFLICEIWLWMGVGRSALVEGLGSPWCALLLIWASRTLILHGPWVLEDGWPSQRWVTRLQPRAAWTRACRDPGGCQGKQSHCFLNLPGWPSGCPG